MSILSFFSLFNYSGGGTSTSFTMAGYNTGAIDDFLDSIEHYDTAGDSWTTLNETLVQKKSVGGSATINQKIYIPGGYFTGELFSDDNQEFDTSTYATSSLNSIPNPNRMGFCEISNKGYHFGGYVSASPFDMDYCWEYDPSIDSWDSGLTNVPNSVGVSCNLGNSNNSKGYSIMGSQYYSPHVLDYNYEYDPSDDSWTTLTPYIGDYTKQRSYLHGFCLGLKNYICGGQLTYGSASSLCDEYDISTDTWTYKTSMNHFADEHSAYELSGFGFSTAGNYGGSHGYHMKYDSDLNTWTDMQVINIERKANAGNSV